MSQRLPGHRSIDRVMGSTTRRNLPLAPLLIFQTAVLLVL